jgi:4-hydroxy-tetrahydrodipicolinate reductase
MGRALIQTIAAADDMQLIGAIESLSSSTIGQDAGTVAGLPPSGINIVSDAEMVLTEANGVIDFSSPTATVVLAKHCAVMNIPLVTGTTGLSHVERETLVQSAKQIPIVFAPNMSVGINVLFQLVAEAARLLGPDYDLEIVEAHHHQKADAPSGTALRLADILAQATTQKGSLRERAMYGRQGNLGPRPNYQIGIHAVRGGDIVGDHTVMYCGTGERLELIHRASSRLTFAQGALRALRWALKQSAGLYGMEDVLGLR